MTIPAKYNGTPFTVEDTLPDGLNLEKGPDKKAITDPVAVKIDGQSYPLDQASVSEQDDQPVSLEIVSDSIKVTNMATGAELPENAYSYVLSSENNGNGKILYKIAFTLPDQIPIKIQYAYKVNGSAGAMCTLSNSAHLDSITQGKMNSETRQQMRVSQSSVTSEEIGLTIFKTDQDNSEIKLSLAQFELFKYNPSTGQFDPVLQNGQPEIFSTNKDGMISLGENELNFGTAYELKEIQAPEGYEKSDEVFRFMLLDGSQCEKAMPAGFEKNAQIFYTSGVLYVPNRKLIHNRQTISVNKKWLASNGKPATPAADSIAINLYQTLSDGTRSIVKQNLVLNKANGWSIQIDDLPVYQMETIDGSEQPDGQKKISYSIEETTKSDQWESKVEHDGQNFTLTNTIKSKPIALPHTGSSNLGLLAGASAALILTGTLIETRNRKNRNKRV